jgi:hypothetical protein
VKLSDVLNDLSHQYAKTRACNFVVMSSVARAFSAFQTITKAKPYAEKGNPRAQERMMDAQNRFNSNAATAWSVIAHTEATELYYSEESKDPVRFNIDVPAVVEFIANSGSRPITDEVIAQRAKASGLSIDKVRAKIDLVRQKDLLERGSLHTSFAAYFQDAEFSGEDGTMDVEVPAERVAAWIEERMDKLLTYNSDVSGSLTLLAADAKIVAEHERKQIERDERSGEGSREIDQLLANVLDLTQAAASRAA